VRLFRWPNRDRIKGVEYTFRLSVIAGEAETPIEQRTFPFTVITEKGMDPRRIQSAVMVRAGEAGAAMAGIMEREILAALRAEGIDV
jgi:hypothetical protein